MNVNPVAGLGALIALVVLFLGLLGLLRVVPLSAPVVFGMLIGLAVAYLLGARWTP